MFNPLSPTESAANSHGEDAISLLKKDHREVESLFASFAAAQDGRQKRGLALQICKALDIHARIEEKVFYPAARDEVEAAEALINEGFVEHESIKRLVAQIPKLSTNDDFFEARMKVLKEYVQHHVKEEESSTFPKLQNAGLDMNELGRAMLKLKEQLLARSRRHAGTASSREAESPGAARSS